MMQRSDSHTWWSLHLGDGILAAATCEQIKDDFRQRQAASSQPADMAVFARWEEGGLHCRVVALFSPACAAWAERLGAVPCAVPGRVGLELLAGDPGCWEALLPKDRL